MISREDIWLIRYFIDRTLQTEDTLCTGHFIDKIIMGSTIHTYDNNIQETYINQFIDRTLYS